MTYDKLHPLGEEIWVRRDLTDHGGLFLARETSVLIFTIILFIALPLLSLSTSKSILPLAESTLGSKGPLIILLTIGIPAIICVPLFLKMYFQWLKVIKLSRHCPIWFHAEQVNPKELTIFHFKHPATKLLLLNSNITTRKETSLFKNYTTLTITDKSTEISATLGLLTHEEYNRFMQYWNAAQEKPSA